MKSLYAYYGLLELHSYDAPGHSLYQIGLMQSIKETYGIEKFDFFSYYPAKEVKPTMEPYPLSVLGDVFNEYRTDLTGNLNTPYGAMLASIQAGQYDRIFLKARFRNLSALAKKLKDAELFENILDEAIKAGYVPYVVDTDLSLPNSFIRKYGDSIKIIVPSVDLPGISETFLDKCIAARDNTAKRRMASVVYYGNINTSSYKAGNSKDEMLRVALNTAAKFSDLTLIGKASDACTVPSFAKSILRNDLNQIWEELSDCSIMLNVTKPKYEESRFIPARIYEAMIFGMIPISYGFEFLCPAFSFNTTDDLTEILKYLIFDCSEDDRELAFQHFVSNYKKYINSIDEMKRPQMSSA